MGGIKSRLQNMGKNHHRPSRGENEGSTVQSTKSAHSQVETASSNNRDRTLDIEVSASDTGNGTPNQRGISTTQTTTNARART